MRRVGAGLVLCVLLCGVAYPWGWWVHEQDCLLYLDRLETEPLPGPRGDAELLRDNLDYFLLGCWMPDWARVVFGIPASLSHKQDFVWFVYEKAISEMDDDPWKVALAVGNMHHVASDIVAQDMACSYFACKAGFGLLDVFPGFYDYEAGENEVFFEVFVDILFGDYSDIAGVILRVLSDQETFQELKDFVQRCIDEYSGRTVAPAADAREVLRDAAELATKGDDASVLELYLRFASDAPKERLDIPREVDAYELRWVLASPAFQNPDFYSEYFDYFMWLATQIARDMVPGSRWFEVWPTWNGRTFASGGLQGLAYGSNGMDLNCTQLIWGARFATPDGATVASLDVDDWPERLKFELSLINVLPEQKDITVRVRARSGGLDWRSDPILAEDTFTISDDPASYDEDAPASISLSFDMPSPLNIYGLYFELYAGGSDLPYLVSLPLAYFTAVSHDPFKAVYQDSLFCDECFPAHPAVVEPVSDLEVGWLQGRVVDRLSGRPVGYAQVSIGDGAWIMASRWGYFQFDGLEPADVEVSASAAGYFPGSVSVRIEAGTGAWATLELDPMIEIRDGGDYTPNNRSVFVSFDPLKKFSRLRGYSVGAGTSPDEADLIPFTSVGFDTELELTFEQPVEDGTKVYVLVRPDVTGVAARHSSSDGITIDSSPPEIERLTIGELSTEGGFRVGFSVAVREPHSPVAGVYACLGSAPAICDLVAPAPVDPDDAVVALGFEPAVAFLNVWAENAAGLVSDIASVRLRNDEAEGGEGGCGWF